MPSEVVIETRALSKVFGQQRALDGLDLQVTRGAIGLLGPNGAGKSTFMKCLLQLQPITSGSAKLLGHDVGSKGREIRKRVGYTPEQDCHIPGMVGCEFVTYCAQLCGLPFQVARQRAHEMLDFVGMGQERYRKVDTYSTGMRQRVKLAMAYGEEQSIRIRPSRSTARTIAARRTPSRFAYAISQVTSRKSRQPARSGLICGSTKA